MMLKLFLLGLWPGKGDCGYSVLTKFLSCYSAWPMHMLAWLFHIVPVSYYRILHWILLRPIGLIRMTFNLGCGHYETSC